MYLAGKFWKAPDAFQAAQLEPAHAPATAALQPAGCLASARRAS